MKQYIVLPTVLNSISLSADVTASDQDGHTVTRVPTLGEVHSPFCLTKIMEATRPCQLFMTGQGEDLKLVHAYRLGELMCQCMYYICMYACVSVIIGLAIIYWLRLFKCIGNRDLNH